MDLWENIALAVNGLLANKMRAVLTMLGIIIGIGSVIAIVTVGNSMTIAFSESMKEMGTNKIMVTVQEKNMNYEDENWISHEPQEGDLLTDDMIHQYASRYSDTVESISLMESVGSGKAQLGSKTANVDIKGVNADYAKAENKELLYGRFITPRDVYKRQELDRAYQMLMDVWKETAGQSKLEGKGQSSIQTDFYSLSVLQYLRKCKLIEN